MKQVIIIITTIVAINMFSMSKAFAESDNNPPTLVSEAAIMIDSKTGRVLYDKNENKQMYPASLTKIATAVYAIETGNLDDIVTVSEKARNAEGTSVYLEEGEQVTLKKLIQGLLINSGNDAGVAIAEHLSGSVKQFSSDINKYLKNVIGVQNTHFENPHGLFDPNHVTTAKDLVKITQYAMKNETFREIFGTKKLKWNGASWDTTLITHHKLMRQIPYKGITGGKTGFVNQSGFTLATTAERKNLSLIVITLNSYIQSAAYNDTTNLLDYGFENFETSSISKGATFSLGEQKYMAPKRIPYTHSLNEQVSKKVIDNGSLEVTNEAGNVIASYPLNKVETEENVVKQEKIKEEIIANKDAKTSSMVGGHFLEFIFMLFITVLSIAGIIYHIRQLVKKVNTSNGG
ncbi:D-alanyl-D-alanine carboxypeptidase family protein [Lentibacillus salinarum]|uniref:D-alanyl-D-alanine carboxypeptidase family protein n=1 Tax=Lentibacillus salinarum TaxID=446820 RepID=A0ABW3ZXU2_9BACI